MRELIYLVATSLDGFIAGPGGDTGAFPMSGDHIAALFRDWPETLPGPALAAAGITPHNRKFDTVLMGWNTYQVGLAGGLTSPYPHLNQWVFSRHKKAPDAAVKTCSENPLEAVRALKQEPGAGIWLCGGGALADALWPEIDRLILKVNPIVLGHGIHLRAVQPGGDAQAQSFRLTSSTRFESAVMMNEYAREPVAAA